MLIAVGASICFLSISVMLTSEMEREHSGLGSGLFNAGRQVGGSIGLAALTVVAAARTQSLLGLHHGAVAQATARGYGFALLAAAGLLVVGILVLATHANRRRLRAAARIAAESRPAGLASP